MKASYYVCSLCLLCSYILKVFLIILLFENYF